MSILNRQGLSDTRWHICAGGDSGPRILPQSESPALLSPLTQTQSTVRPNRFDAVPNNLLCVRTARANKGKSREPVVAQGKRSSPHFSTENPQSITRSCVRTLLCVFVACSQRTIQDRHLCLPIPSSPTSRLLLSKPLFTHFSIQKAVVQTLHGTHFFCANIRPHLHARTDVLHVHYILPYQ